MEGTNLPGISQILQRKREMSDKEGKKDTASQRETWVPEDGREAGNRCCWKCSRQTVAEEKSNFSGVQTLRSQHNLLCTKEVTRGIFQKETGKKTPSAHRAAPVSRYLKSPTGLCEHQAHTRYTYIHVGKNVHAHKINSF